MELKFALETFDADISKALESAAILQDMNHEELDMMPREELFLVSSFLLNVRQAASQVSDMLDTAKLLVQQRREAGTWRRLFLPRIRWRKWLNTGGEHDESIPVRDRRLMGQSTRSKDTLVKLNANTLRGSQKTRQDIEQQESPDPDSGHTINSNPQVTHRDGSTDIPITMRTRIALGALFDWIQDSDHLSYAFKLTIAAFLVSFPAFVPSLNSFYYERRGTWAGLQLIFVFDVAIGTSIYNAYVRAIGTTLGSLWGWAAYTAGNGNPYICAAMLFVGLIPSTYVQLGSQYSKAGMVTIVSMSVVALATEVQSVPDSSTNIFLNRWVAFLVGGVVALFVEVSVLPVKARTRLVEALTASIRYIGEMESCVGYGADSDMTLKDGFPADMNRRYHKASNQAKAALGHADTFLPFCASEPRFKGSFKPVAKVYEEMIFVLRQIVDKMDNMIQFRVSYGSGPLEELNPLIWRYRRNVIGAISLTIYAVQEALVTKYPLPQFIPSARLAHLRLVNKVREVVRQGAEAAGGEDAVKSEAIKRTLRRKYMSWNAASAALSEYIEYLEELVDLTKLLVGASEFRTGLLARPTLQEYAKITGHFVPPTELLPFKHSDDEHEKNEDHGSQLEKVPTANPDLPISLQRIQSRKQEAGLRKRQQIERQQIDSEATKLEH